MPAEILTYWENPLAAPAEILTIGQNRLLTKLEPNFRLDRIKAARRHRCHGSHRQIDG
jgi:hypothetical protein